MSLTWCLSQKAARSTQKSKATVPSYLAIFSHRKTAPTKQCLCFRLGSTMFKTRDWRWRQARENSVHQLKRQHATTAITIPVEKWSLPNKVSMLGQLSITLVGGVQGSAPQWAQLHVHKGRYPHFPRARALRERLRTIAKGVRGENTYIYWRNYVFEIMLKRYTWIYKHARPDFWVPDYTNQNTIVTYVINHKE